MSNAVLRSVEWLLIHIGHHQIQMTMERQSRIDLVQLVRYSDKCFQYIFHVFVDPALCLKFHVLNIFPFVMVDRWK